MAVASNTNFVVRNECPLCRGSAEVVWHESIADSWIGPYLVQRYRDVSLEDFKDVPYEVRHCPICDFYYQTYVATDTFLEHMYIGEGKETSLKKKRDADINRFIGFAREAERIAVLLARRPHDVTVLEFGAGWGFWSLMAKAYGYQVHGFDTAPIRVAYAKENGIHFYTSLKEIESGSFDFVFSDQVLEHITDPVGALREATRCLCPGGLVRLGVPNAGGADTLLRNSRGRPLKELHPLEHINGFTYRSLVVCGEAVGLTVLPSLTIARKLIRRVGLTQNAQYLQDAVKHVFSQNSGTLLYFIKT